MRTTTLRNLDAITLPEGWKPSEELLSLEMAIKAVTPEVFEADSAKGISQPEDLTTIVDDLADELLTKTNGDPALLSIKYLINQGCNITVTDASDGRMDWWYGEIYFGKVYHIVFKQTGQVGIDE